MNLAFYGFQRAPFAQVPDPESLFATEVHRAAFADLLDSVQAKSGFVTFVAEIGLGKTTLARLLAQHLDPATHRVIYVFNPPAQLADPIGSLLAEFGENDSGLSVVQKHDALARHLIDCYRRRRTVVLIIDEAHTLTPANLEALRLLSNLEAQDEKLLHIVLVGQPELDAMLDSPDLRQLRQRVAARCGLRPLTRAESAEYLLFRMRRAGLEEPSTAMTGAAIRSIVRVGQGVPRLLNIAAERVLNEGSRRKVRPIDWSTARRALATVPSAKRAPRRRPFFLAASAGLLAIGLGTGFCVRPTVSNHAIPRARVMEAADHFTLSARG